ncbi:MAG TPA: hypothetical protein VJP59_09115 [Gemmatimonadota bacterium]|nr:hypothetical protein [Gemmatimonadota bacterium]
MDIPRGRPHFEPANRPQEVPLLYSVALFLHVLGVLGLFVALGLEWTSLRCLSRAANAAEARAWFGLFPVLRRIYPWSFVAILVTGIYMMAVGWGARAWIAVGLLGMLAIPALGSAMTARRIRATGPVISEAQGVLDEPARARLADPVLHLSLRLRMGLAVGIVFLMTVKPDWIGSVVAIVAFTGAGALSARPR